MNDLKFAFRQMLKNPGFTAVAVLTLALGIGATTAIFSVVYAVVLRPLPFPESERLVAIWTQTPQLDRLPMAAANHSDLKAQATVFADIAILSRVTNYNLTGDGEPERLQTARIAANLFPLLRVKPALGRSFTEDENQPGQDRAVILSHGLWQRHYAGDPNIVGKTIRLENVPHTIVGVMGPQFQYPTPEVQIWTPLTIDPEKFRTRTGYNHLTVARLKPGVTLEQAQTEVNLISRRLAQNHPQTNKDMRFAVTLLRRDIAGVAQRPLIVLLGAALGLLFIGCCNLLLAMLGIYGVIAWTVNQRTREIGVRMALGAQRSTVLALVLRSGFKLAGAGIALGLIGAAALTQLLRSLLFGVTPTDVLTFAAVPVLFVGVALLACWMPARRAANIDPMEALRYE